MIACEVKEVEISAVAKVAATAVAAAAVLAAAELKLPVALSAYLCLAENMPGGGAQRPGDVVTMRDGTTVEVLNTDAEGRMVMADALVDAVAAEPDLVMDVATLTGAAVVALGKRTGGVMGTETGRSAVVAAAERAVAQNAERAIANERRLTAVEGRPVFDPAAVPERAAFDALSVALPSRRITVNLSPADLPKEGSHYDLPIALALLAAALFMATRRKAGA